jgi:signal transduction histidine kinase
LVITKDIVELHGGSIMVDTTARRGTTFVLTLPAVPPA